MTEILLPFNIVRKSRYSRKVTFESQPISRKQELTMRSYHQVDESGDHELLEVIEAMKEILDLKGK